VLDLCVAMTRTPADVSEELFRSLEGQFSPGQLVELATAIALETSKGDLPLALGLGVILVTLVLLLNAAAYTLKEAAQRRYG